MMDTPILDFLKGYALEGMARFHMPGHKGTGPIGCESWDLTEIKGADSLYEVGGVIAQSEANAAALFGTRKTFYSTEGSSQCIRAMLRLAQLHRPAGTAPVVLAARNVHKTFLSAAALLDLEVEWLWREEPGPLCACPVTGAGLDRALSEMDRPPLSVYITTPDYLGNELPVKDLARVCRRYGTLLLVDSAHGAYLPFVGEEPLNGWADLWCASAHKTLPVLTGGAYLHVGKNAPLGIEDGAKEALALFGSTSPSYLTLASLDACNAWLAGEGPERMRAIVHAMDQLKLRLAEGGWRFAPGEALKLALEAGSLGWNGTELADLLRTGGVEPEYADPDHVVLMASGNTTEEELRFLEDALAAAKRTGKAPLPRWQIPAGAWPARREMSVRQAVLAPSERVEIKEALGRVCAAPSAACPPAIPVAMPGEVIGPEALEVLRHYGVSECAVVR